MDEGLRRLLSVGSDAVGDVSASPLARETPSNHSPPECTERSLLLYSCSLSFVFPNSSSARAVAILLFARMPYVPLRHAVTEYPINRVAG